jgi:hypothetical protein
MRFRSFFFALTSLASITACHAEPGAPLAAEVAVTTTTTSSGGDPAVATNATANADPSRPSAAPSFLQGVVEPADAGAADVRLTVRADSDSHHISKLIYGVNTPRDFNGIQKGVTMLRAGGNRWTAYNWENNASNAGIDYQNQSDGYLLQKGQNADVPGAALSWRVDFAQAAGAAAMITVPIQGYVAADRAADGDVSKTPNYLQTRFKKIAARKDGPLSETPDTSDGVVYQDEFVNWVKQKWPGSFAGEAPEILFSLDNEPDLWRSTHPLIQGANVQAAELVTKNAEYGKMIKDLLPQATVLGFVSYGYKGFDDLQNAFPQRDFTSHYLAEMKKAEEVAGKRVVDVLDIHWYPEARGDDCRINGTCVTAGAAEARVQAPRSLNDASYVEDSWISKKAGAINLIPSMKEKIAKHYPGTKLGFSEYYYGGGNHISGAIAQADVLGIFGQEDVYLANLWEQAAQNDFIYAAMRIYTAFDGKDAKFGDTSVRATTSDRSKVTVYASIDEASPERMVIVAINKSASKQSAALSLAAFAKYGSAKVYQLSGERAEIVQAPALEASGTNAFRYEMPAHSISVIVPQG